MNKQKKALVVLNMGGVRNKKELNIFLHNMFNDENILKIKHKKIRSLVAFLIVFFRIHKAWENYKQIGGSSPLHKITELFTRKLQIFLPNIFITYSMRYTEPFAKTAIDQIKQKGIKDVMLLPLFPHYSLTTVKTGCDDFIEHANNKFNITICEPFYKNSVYNEIICNEIVNAQGKYLDYHIIFSAHGLPQKMIDKYNDPYKKQIEDHVEILKEQLSHYATPFKSINLAYQSKVGPGKWLSPSLEETLQYFKNKKVIIYPISFVIDNSETIFELDIAYRSLAKQIGVRDYKVCKCINDNNIFTKEIINLFK
ncbi:Ferrochelatase, protoheme ferro-lyase [hydrothermal vent metagenome]|uniref:Ferrochelatase, protoheme ferro-lyase n=1 Tax=hydrothermal vent metagenome TaxID=652676 RepID=A0A3B1DRT5_9ZZZZ